MLITIILELRVIHFFGIPEYVMIKSHGLTGHQSREVLFKRQQQVY